MTSKKRQFCGNCAGEIEVEEGKVIGRMTWPSSSERALIEVSECGTTFCFAVLHHLSNPELVDLFKS